MIITRNQNTLTLYGDIFDGDGMYFASELNAVEGHYTTIHIRLHSMGGAVFDGNLMYNLMKRCDKRIVIYVDGVAASMGDGLLGAADEVYMARNAFLMKHAPSGYTYGTASEHEERAKLLRNMESNFIEDWKENTGKTKEEVSKWLIGDNWFSAKEALAEGLIAGIVDPVIDIDIDKEIQENTSNMTAQYIGGRFDALLVAQAKVSASQSTTATNNNKYQYMKKELITALGLTGVNEQSSDTAVVSAVQQKVTAEASDYKTKYEAEKKAHEALKETIKADVQTKVKAMLDEGQAAGKFQASERAVYEAIGENSGIEALQTVLGTKEGRKPIQVTSSTGGTTSSAATEGTWDDYQKTPQGRKALQAMAKEDPEGFSALYEAKYNVKPEI